MRRSVNLEDCAVGEEFYIWWEDKYLRCIKIDYVVNGIVWLEGENKGQVYEFWNFTETYEPLARENTE